MGQRKLGTKVLLLQGNWRLRPCNLQKMGRELRVVVVAKSTSRVLAPLHHLGAETGLGREALQ